MKLRYKISIGITVFFTLNLLCKGLTGNFDLQELMPPALPGSEWDTTSLDSDFPIETILGQKFHYLGKGHQAFAFVSEDGQHVLKLFKPHYPHIELLGESFNFTYIPFAKWAYRLCSPKHFLACKRKDMTSYYHARTLFHKESLTEYAHLVTTSHIQEKLHLVDKIHIARDLDPNTLCFTIQKKVEPLPTVLLRLLKEGKETEIAAVLSDLRDLLARRAELGFYKPTHKFHANFGCLGLTPIQLDIGNLVMPKDLGIDAPPIDLTSSLQGLKKWADLRYPELSPFVDEVICKKSS